MSDWFGCFDPLEIHPDEPPRVVVVGELPVGFAPDAAGSRYELVVVPSRAASLELVAQGGVAVVAVADACELHRAIERALALHRQAEHGRITMEGLVGRPVALPRPSEAAPPGPRARRDSDGHIMIGDTLSDIAELVASVRFSPAE